MPAHIRFLLKHACVGLLIALGFTGMVLWTNLANIRHLVLNTAEGPLALGIFVVFCTITFGAVQMGIRIMMLGDDEPPSNGRRDAPEPVQLAEPVPVRVARGEP
ncbi:MAG: hypothetical protein AAF914_00885 [Pseudomonadota bacterium]